MRTRYLGFVALVSLAPGLLFGCGADSQPSAEEARAAIREAEEAQSRIKEQIAERALTGTSAPGGATRQSRHPPTARNAQTVTQRPRLPRTGRPILEGQSRAGLSLTAAGGLCT